ncbi:MAG: peptidoglycan DD-metalloendopeptidase family protein [Rikenellaceae bacterium]
MHRLKLLILTLLSLAVVAPLVAQQQGSSVEAQKRVIAAIEKQIAQDQKAISSIRKDKSAAESRVQSLARQVEQRNRLLEAQERQVELITAEIDTTSMRLTGLNSELSSEQEAYGAMVREAYRNYRQNNFVSYIFASDDFNDMARRIVNIRRVAQLRERRICAIDSLTLSLDSVRVVLLDRKASLDSVIMDIKQQKVNIQQDVNAARSQVSQMSTKERQALQSKALQEQKLSTAIDQLRRLSKGNTQGASFSAKTSALNLPVKGGRVKRYMDNMAEVVGDVGAGVISIYEGKVVDIKQNRITGRYDVYIAHGEYIASYAGLKSVFVKRDESVGKNQTIGEVGAAIDVLTMNTEHKIIFGIYPPSPSQKMKAADCFKR